MNPNALQSCSLDLNCSSTFSCVSCPLGFIFSNIPCILYFSCARCLPTSNSTRPSCYNGKYLYFNSQCISCPTGCANCLSKSTCLTFTTCAPCNSPRALCQGTPNVYTGCVSGYALGAGKCISNFNFGFSVTLSVTFSQFYFNYVAFLIALANNVNSPYEAINLQLISSASAIVQGTVSTNSQSRIQPLNHNITCLLLSVSRNLKNNQSYIGVEVP